MEADLQATVFLLVVVVVVVCGRPTRLHRQTPTPNHSLYFLTSKSRGMTPLGAILFCRYYCKTRGNLMVFTICFMKLVE